MDNWDAVFDCGILTSLHVSRWGARKMIKLEDLGLEESESQEKIKKLFRLGSKRLINPEHLDIFISIEAKARRLINSYGRPFKVLPTAYFVPDESFLELKPKLDVLKELYYNELDSFISSYDEYRREWLDTFTEYVEELADTHSVPNKEKYVNSFIGQLEGFYPGAHDLKSKFSFEYTTFTITAPADKISSNEYYETVKSRKEIQQHYNEQIKTQINGFIENIIIDLRSELLKVASHVGEIMASGKKITNKSLSSMRKKLEEVKRLNFVDDGRTNNTLKKLEEYANIDASEYRNDEEFAEEFREALTTISANLAETLEEDIDDVVAKFGETAKRKLRLKKKREMVTN